MDSPSVRYRIQRNRNGLRAATCLPVMVFLAGLSGMDLAAATITETFDSVATLGDTGWIINNQSNPSGVVNWFQGNSAIFPANSGAPTAYAAANYLSAGQIPGATVSNWLLTPAFGFGPDTQLTFYTRSAGNAPDSLQILFSTAGTSANVGPGPNAVGDFTNLALNINAGLTATGYPTDWTPYTVSVGNLPAGTEGRFAFRYFVPDTSINGDYIGIDDVTISGTAESSVPEPATWGASLIGLLSLLRFWRRSSGTRI